MAMKQYQIILVIIGTLSLCYICIWIPAQNHQIIREQVFSKIDEIQTLYNSEIASIANIFNTSTDDENKYNICDEENGPKITIIVHHKTGTHLFREFMLTLRNYHKYKCNDTEPLQFRAHGWLHLNPNGLGPFYHLTKNFHRHKTFVIIHSIRDPVDTILSAYNYHRIISPEPEQRRHKFDNFTQLRKHRQKKQRGIYTEQQWCYNYMFFEESSPLKISKELQKTYSVQSVLKDVFNVSMGLAYEYTRFFCFDAKDIMNTYRSLKELDVESVIKGRDEELIVLQVSMEQFHDNFNETAYSVLDAMRILNDEDRQRLMNEFVKYNIHDKSTMDSHNSLISKHITQGIYDRDEQIDILLGNNDRCNNIKDMTSSLDMSWKYTDYC